MNHQTIAYPLSAKQQHLQKIYATCNKYFTQFKNSDHITKLDDVISRNANNHMEKLPKTTIKNLNRSKTIYPNENNIQLDKSSVIKSEQNPQTISIDTKTLRNLVTNSSCKSSNLSRFALALVHALQNIDPSLTPTKPYVVIEMPFFSDFYFYLFHRQQQQQQHDPIFSYYLSDQATHSSSESPIEENANTLLDQFLKNTNLSQVVTGIVKYFTITN